MAVLVVRGRQMANPAVDGRGAGSYESWWSEHGTLATFVKDAHSLYLQTLGELGVVGLVLLLTALTAGATAGIARLRVGTATPG